MIMLHVAFDINKSHNNKKEKDDGMRYYWQRMTGNIGGERSNKKEEHHLSTAGSIQLVNNFSLTVEMPP